MCETMGKTDEGENEMEEEESVNEVLDLPPSSWLDQPTSCIKISIKTSTEKKKR